MKKLLIGLLFIISYVFYLILLQILFGDDNLVCIKGQLFRKYNFTKTETEDDTLVDYVYLNFQLKGDNRFFTLKVAVADKVKEANVFAGLDLDLKHAGELEVFVKKGDLASMSPKVYQIKADGQNIFSMRTPRNNNIVLFRMLAGLLLIFCIGIYFLNAQFSAHLINTHRMSRKLI